jgi:predicted nuclease of predicted toxin-antitoxin system
MTIWVDAQLSPEISTWIKTEFLFNCIHIREIGLLRANDKEIFLKARKEDNIIIVSKDKDFIDLLETYGPPPKIIWITTGNTSTKR